MSEKNGLALAGIFISVVIFLIPMNTTLGFFLMLGLGAMIYMPIFEELEESSKDDNGLLILSVFVYAVIFLIIFIVSLSHWGILA